MHNKGRKIVATVQADPAADYTENASQQAPLTGMVDSTSSNPAPIPGLTVLFSQHHCVLQDHTLQRVVVLGKEAKGLYCLDTALSPTTVHSKSQASSILPGSSLRDSHSIFA